MGDASLLDWMFKAFATLCMAIIGYFTKAVVDDVREIKKENADCRLNHANLRTHISENYATKSDLNSTRLETNDSLKRLHDRIDQLPKDIIQLLRKEQ